MVLPKSKSLGFNWAINLEILGWLKSRKIWLILKFIGMLERKNQVGPTDCIHSTRWCMRLVVNSQTVHLVGPTGVRKYKEKVVVGGSPTAIYIT